MRTLDENFATIATLNCVASVVSGVGRHYLTPGSGLAVVSAMTLVACMCVGTVLMAHSIYTLVRNDSV